MTINEETGCISLPEIGASIAPFLSRSQFLQTRAFAGASAFVQNEHWLTAELRMPSGKYSWGEISSHLDDKGGSSSITIRYGRRNA